MRVPHRPLLLAFSFLLGACSRSPADEAPTAAASTPASPAAPSGSPHGSAPTEAKPATPPPASGATQAGGVAWVPPPTFVPRAPESRMRAAEYAVTAPGEQVPAVLAVFFFGPGQGGSVDANVDRWVGQFTTADGKPAKDSAKIEKRTVGNLAVTRVDVRGNYASGMPGAPAGTAPNQRMLAAIAEGPNGPVFFKLVGPAASVDYGEEPFDALVGTLHLP